ncbi:bacteriorhodopsin-like [Candidatus Pelagibacter sp.]|nr:bacteriorhodopsin-like [Candidatus Pelagibacter sp.]
MGCNKVSKEAGSILITASFFEINFSLTISTAILTADFEVLYEVFSGEAGKAAAKSGNKALVTAFGAMRMIVTVGWAIYPLGYVFGYLTGGVDADSLNVIYNIADLLNKTAFGLIIWAAAVQSGGRKAK